MDSYSVNNDDIIVMHLLGIHHTAVEPLANYCKSDYKVSLPALRRQLRNLTNFNWN